MTAWRDAAADLHEHVDNPATTWPRPWARGEEATAWAKAIRKAIFFFVSELMVSEDTKHLCLSRQLLACCRDCNRYAVDQYVFFYPNYSLFYCIIVLMVVLFLYACFLYYLSV